jgi:hypothetical protein
MIMASAAAAMGQLARAAQLFGANAAMREPFGEVADLMLSAPPAPASDREVRARVAAKAALVAVCAVLGEDAFATAWDQGRALMPDEVFALALA